MSLEKPSDSSNLDIEYTPFTPFVDDSWRELLSLQRDRANTPAAGAKLPGLELTTGDATLPVSTKASADAAPDDRTILQTLGQSTNETEKAAAESIQKLLDSEDPADQKEGKQLLAMLNDEKKRALAVAMVDKLLDPEQRRAFMEMLNKPEMSKAAATLSEMLVKGGDSGAPYAVQALMQMLHSEDKDAKKDAERVIKMLNDPAEHATGKAIVENLVGSIHGQPALRQMFAMLDDPKQKEAAQTVLALLKSANENESSAGRNVLALMAGNEFSDAEKKNLLTVLGDAGQKKDACTIINGLSEPAEIREMLKIHADPKMKNASAALLEMLGEEYSQRTASELLRALSSNIDIDKADGQRLLNMMNSDKPEDRANAQNVLRLVTSMDQRTKILDLLANPDTKAGVERLFEMLDRTGRRKREPGERILSMLTSTDAVERKQAERLVKMLAGDKASQETAETIVTKLAEPQKMKAMMDLLETNKEAANKILSMINSEDMNKRVAAHALLDLKADREGDTTADKLLQMLADPKQEAQAMAILSLDNPRQIAKLMELRGQKDTEKGAEELIKMLGSKDDSDKRAAKSLLDMFNNRRLIAGLASDGLDGFKGDNGNDIKVAERLLKMLGDPEKADTAKKILTRIEDNSQRDKMLKLLDQDKVTGTRLLEHIGKDHQVGLSILDKIDDPKHINKVLDLLQSPDHGRAAWSIKRMLETGGTQNLVRLLTSDKEGEKQLGETLLKELNESKSFTPTAELVLNANLTPQETKQLMDMRGNRENYRATMALLNALQNPEQKAGAQSILALLRSEDPASKAAGEQLFKRLNSNEDRATMDTIMSQVQTPAAMKLITEMLASEKDRPAAQELLKLLGGSEQSQQTGRTLFAMLTSKNETTRKDGERVLAMLASKDPKEQALGKNIIDYLNSPAQISKFFELTNKDAAKTPEQKAAADQLMAMMSSSDTNQKRGVGNLVTMLQDGGRDAAAAKKVLEMLGKPETQKDGAAILTQLSKPSHIAELNKLMSDPKHAGAAKILMDMLKSGDLAQAQSVMALLEALDTNSGLNISLGGRGGENGPPAEIVNLVEQLSNPKTAELAKQALLTARSREELTLPAQMLQTPEGQKTLQRLLDMMKDKDQKEVAQTILGSRLSPQAAAQFLKLIDDPKRKPAVDTLMSMLKDEDIGKAFAAGRFLNMLGSADANQKQAAEKILDMLADPEQRDLANNILLKTRPREMKLILDILNDPKMAGAAEEIKELLNSNDFREDRVLGTLIEMLGSANAATKKEGERLLAMLNTERHRHTALRMLRERSDVNGQLLN